MRNMTSNAKDSPTRICQRCVLPETFPGIVLDERGLCRYCQKEESGPSGSPGIKAKYRTRFEKLIGSVKGAAPLYDAIIAYSGGKDSSYTLKLLTDLYGLRLVAFTLDNHFVSPAAWQNIRKVTDALQTDHIRFSPPWQVIKVLFCKTARSDIFPAPTLLRASAICTACIGIVKSLVLKTALEMSIPLVAFGWSPGQAPIQSAIMKTNAALTLKNQSVFRKAFSFDTSQEIERYLIPDTYYERYKDRFPHNIHPLAFFDYDEDEIKRQLDNLGWLAPTDTDTNSTNCLLNAFANHCHLERHGFHPYVWEIAGMVRQGVMRRDEGIQKIYTEQDQKMVEYARERLGL